jgi:hypothetical protein
MIEENGGTFPTIFGSFGSQGAAVCGVWTIKRRSREQASRQRTLQLRPRGDRTFGSRQVLATARVGATVLANKWMIQ